MADLSSTFFETETFQKMRNRIFRVLEARDANLRRGQFEQKGACLIGPPESAKSRMVKEVIRWYETAAVATGAAAYRFGVAVEMVIEAIGEALSEGQDEVNLDHFAEAYFLRADCDEEMNPFISDHWRGIDATIVLDRYLAQKKYPEKGKTRK